MSAMKWYALCHVPITGEQYLREFDDKAEFEAFLVEEYDNVGKVIIGEERDIDEFVGGGLLPSPPFAGGQR